MPARLAREEGGDEAEDEDRPDGCGGVLEYALRFYADRERYRERHSMSRHERPTIELDQGTHARLALESDGRAGDHLPEDLGRLLAALEPAGMPPAAALHAVYAVLIYTTDFAGYDKRIH